MTTLLICFCYIRFFERYYYHVHLITHLMSKSALFVTVGTTRFDALIEAVDTCAFYELAAELGLRRVTLQIGSGNYVPTGDYSRKSSQFFKKGTQDLTKSTHLWVATTSGLLSIQWFRFSANLEAVLREHEFVISHAGAGSLLEGLRLARKMLVVVNEQLMDNHQIELGEVMSKRGYVLLARTSEEFKTNCSQGWERKMQASSSNSEIRSYGRGKGAAAVSLTCLLERLIKKGQQELIEYPSANPAPFVKLLKEEVGVNLRTIF